MNTVTRQRAPRLLAWALGFRVLVAGGYDNNGTLGTAERYDPAAGQWTMTGPLNSPRYFHTATLLSDGNVLFAGGYDISSLASAELSAP